MDREKLRRDAVRQLRRLAADPPVRSLTLSQDEDGTPTLAFGQIDPFLLSGVKLGRGSVELSFYSRLQAIDRLLELAGPGGDSLLEELGLPDWSPTPNEPPGQ